MAFDSKEQVGNMVWWEGSFAWHLFWNDAAILSLTKSGGEWVVAGMNYRSTAPFTAYSLPEAKAWAVRMVRQWMNDVSDNMPYHD